MRLRNKWLNGACLTVIKYPAGIVSKAVEYSTQHTAAIPLTTAHTDAPQSTSTDHPQLYFLFLWTKRDFVDVLQIYFVSLPTQNANPNKIPYAQ